VAVAPKDYAQRSRDEFGVIRCGYDASLSAAHALDTAHRLAAATGPRLRVIRGFLPLAFETPPASVAMGGMASYNDTLRERSTSELESAIATIDAEPGVEAVFTVGAHPRRGIRATRSPARRVSRLRPDARRHGRGVAGRRLREAACR
jgi:hypothetical protein